MYSRYVFLCGAALLAAFAGCGSDNPDGIPVSGEVSFQGKPLDQGAIEFTPLDASHRMSGAPISEGEYSIPAEQGLSAGKYQVRITSTAGGAEVDPDQPPGESGTPAKERIPAEFNTQTKQEVEVKEEGDNTFKFEIP